MTHSLKGLTAEGTESAEANLSEFLGVLGALGG